MIALGCDSAGADLLKGIKSLLDELGLEYRDFTPTLEGSDYTDSAKAVCMAIKNGEAQRGILCCGTGIGMSICANKIKGIRAAAISDYYSALYTRLHNDSNVLCLGGRVLGTEAGKLMARVFLTTDFEGGRHLARVDKMMALELED